MVFKNKICAVVAATGARGIRRQLDAALRTRHATIELRLDWLKDDAEIARFLHQFTGRAARRVERSARPGATLIATCRRKSAGGKYRGSIAKQLVHLSEALASGCH